MEIEKKSCIGLGVVCYFTIQTQFSLKWFSNKCCPIRGKAIFGKPILVHKSVVYIKDDHNSEQMASCGEASGTTPVSDLPLPRFGALTAHGIVEAS